MVYDGHDKLCESFVQKLEAFMDAKQAREQYYESEQAAEIEKRARFDLLKFVNTHFELK